VIYRWKSTALKINDKTNESKSLLREKQQATAMSNIKEILKESEYSSLVVSCGFSRRSSRLTVSCSSSKRKGLLEMIRGVTPATGWKVLIVDKLSIRVLSSVCTMAEIMEEGVTSKSKAC